MQFDEGVLHNIPGTIPVTTQQSRCVARQRSLEVRLGGFDKLARRNFHDV